MNKKYLKENNLLEAHNQFMRLCEWSYVPSTLAEDDDEEQDPNAQGGQDPMMGGEADPMQGGGEQDPNAQGGQDPMMGGGEGQDPNAQGGQDPMMGGGEDPMMGGGEDPMMGGGEDPMMGGGEDPMMGDEGDMEEDDVIDVDDITNAQEKMNDKVNSVGRNLGQVDDKIQALMQSLSNMEQMINNNNAEIAKFKQEFEKRNPTQTEKLNLRSLDSYPFNVNPKDYWEKKGIDPNSNYSGYSDNDEPTVDEYEITNNDIDEFDERAIADSFDIADDLNQDIKKIFGL